MAATWIQLPLDGGGKALDAVSVTTTAVGAPNSSAVLRQVHVFGDPTTFAAQAAVGNSAPAGTEYGLLTRNIPGGTQSVQPAPLAAFSASITTSTGVAGPWTVSSLGNLTLVLTGTYAALTAVFEGSVDNTNWFGIQGVRSDSFIAETGINGLTNTTRAWDFPMLGYLYFRVRATALTSGTAAFIAQGGVMPIDPAPTVGVQQTTKRTYHLTGRNLSFAMTAGLTKQYLAIWHANTVTQNVNIKNVYFTFQSNSAASIITVELVRITTAPTGGTATTPAPVDSSSAAASSSGMTLPSTAGTETANTFFASSTFNLGILAGQTTPPVGPIVLYQSQPLDDLQPLRIRTATTEGLALRLTSTGASTVVITATIEFTEE
jgi:hypothetical protein